MDIDDREDILYHDANDVVALDPVEEDRLTLILSKTVGWVFAVGQPG